MTFNHISKVTSKIYFGKYVDREVENELISANVSVIVDVTHSFDRLIPYTISFESDIIKFPIVDMETACDEDMIAFINFLCDYLNSGHVIYIHCKGGHGRSAVVAALLYGIYYRKIACQALSDIYIAHQKRRIMKRQWRQIGAPQNQRQIDQVIRILDRF